MSDLRRSHQERPRLWGSFRSRLSGSSKRRLGAGNDKKESETAETALPFVSTRSRPRKKSEGATRQSSPRTPGSKGCLPPLRDASPRGVAFLPLFCAPSQKFAPLEDDTLSTRPMVGLASRYNQHYSDIWVSDYDASTRRKTPVQSSSVADVHLQVDSAATLDDNQKEENASLLDARCPPTTSLGHDIEMLSRTLDNAKFSCRDSRSREILEFDVTSVTSHTSSEITLSECSFQADFRQMNSIGFGNEASEEKNFSAHANRLLSTYEIRTRTPPGIIASQLTRRFENRTNLKEAVRLLRETKGIKDGSVNGGIIKDPYRREETKQDSPPMFQPILAGKESQTEIMLYDKPAWETSDTKHGHRIHEYESRTHEIFRSHDKALHYEEKQEEPNEIFSSNEFYVKDICYSRDESHMISELTETVASGDCLYRTETENGAQLHQHDNAFRKAKCFVFYNQPFPHSQQFLLPSCNTNGTVPVKVKDIVGRLETLRRLKADHAEKFGYKDFLPIHEADERDIHMQPSTFHHPDYCVVGATGIHITDSESSLEESTFVVSSVD